MSKLVNDFFEAMEIVSENIAQKIQFDSTIPGTILSHDDESGKYYVNIGTAKMLVGPADFGEKPLYKKDDSVMILIPQGDKSNKERQILYKITKDTENPLQNFNKIFKFVPTTYLSLEPIEMENSIHADGAIGGNVTVDLGIIKIDDDMRKQWVQMNNPDVVELSFELTTNGFRTDYTTNGYYGIMAKVFYKEEDTPKQIFTISSDEFVGNPFGFLIKGARQNFLFDNFYTNENNEHVPLDVNQIEKVEFYLASNGLDGDGSATITVKNCNLVFGYRKTSTDNFSSGLSIEYNQLASNSPEQLVFDKDKNIWQYNYVVGGKVSVTMSAQLSKNGYIYNKQTAQVAKIPSLGTTKLYWCRYSPFYNQTDSKFGTGWEVIHSEDSWVLPDYQLPLDVLDSRIKAVLVTIDKDSKETVLATSPIYRFERKGQTDVAAVVENNGLILEFLDTNGLFFDYDATSSQRSAVGSEFEIRASRTDGGDWVANPPTKIHWSFSSITSMLEPYAEEDTVTLWGDNTTTYDAIIQNPTNFAIKLRRKYKFYDQYNNNKITCVATFSNGQTLSGSITPQFGLGQSIGSSFSCNIVPDRPYLNYKDTAAAITAKVMIFDNEGKDWTTDIRDEDVKWEWYIDSDASTNSIIQNENKKLIRARGLYQSTEVDEGWIEETLGSVSSIYGKKISISSTGVKPEKGNFAILKVTVTVKNANDLKLIDYWPIPIANSWDYSGFDGTSEILYADTGIRINSNAIEYSLYNKQGAKVTNVVMDYLSYGGPLVPVQNKNTTTNTIITNGMVAWQLSNIGDDLFRGRMIEGTAKGTYILTPYQTWNNQKPSIVVKQEDEILWTQPIYYEKQVYAIKQINAWNGESTIDKDGGYIAAPVLIAGDYDNEHRFSGIALGDLNSQNGLYGYNKGTNTLGILTDGSFYFGIGGLNSASITYNAQSNKMNIQANDVTINTIDKNSDSLKGMYFSKNGTTLMDKEREYSSVYFSVNNHFIVTSSDIKVGQWLFIDNALVAQADTQTKDFSWTGSIGLKHYTDNDLVFWINSQGDKEPSNLNDAYFSIDSGGNFQADGKGVINGGFHLEDSISGASDNYKVIIETYKLGEDRKIWLDVTTQNGDINISADNGYISIDANDLYVKFTDDEMITEKTLSQYIWDLITAKMDEHLKIYHS